MVEIVLAGDAARIPGFTKRARIFFGPFEQDASALADLETGSKLRWLVEQPRGVGTALPVCVEFDGSRWMSDTVVFSSQRPSWN